MRVALVANRESGNGTDASETARALENEGCEVSLLGLDELGRLGELPADRIVVAGGDGSIGPVAERAARIDVPLAVVPVGTANDFARALELPLELAEATELAARGRRTRRVDLARMDERPFVNAASVGLSPDAARAAGALKSTLGRFAYAAGALRASARARAIRVAASCDGEDISTGEAWQVIVSNTGAFGGGSEVGEADPADGLLDVTVIPAGSRARLALDGLALRAGWISRRSGVRHRRAAVVRLEVAAGTAYNVDGEILDAGSARFTVEREALQVVVG